MGTPDEAPRWATKIAVLLREDLASWQALNVTSFLVSGITATGPELVGEPYEDADAARSPAPISTWSASPSTARRTPSTRS